MDEKAPQIIYDVDDRLSDSPLVDLVWSSVSVGTGSFMSAAASNTELVVTKQKNAINLTIRGPETKASQADIPEDAEFLGIVLKLGTFIPTLPVSELLDGGINLPIAADKSFWLNGSAWQFPTFDNADTFINKLVHQGLLAYEPVVEAALQGPVKDLSQRSIQRRFIRTMGMPPGTIYQIERARRAMKLLQQGVSILDTVEQAGYSDQPHMTRSLKHFIGQTPAQLLTIIK